MLGDIRRRQNLSLRKHFAVDRHPLPVARLGVRSGTRLDMRGQRVDQRVGVEPGEEPVEGGLAGRPTDREPEGR